MLRPRESGSTTHLWVKSPDRLGMSTMDVLGVVQDLAARGVGVEFIDAPTLSATTSQGEFMLIILAAAAQLERSMIVKPRDRPGQGAWRLREGAQAHAQAGRGGSSPTVLSLRSSWHETSGQTLYTTLAGDGRYAPEPVR
mgnify:FL=1